MDPVLLQSASYVAAAIGVCVAAVYYALNLREMNKNRRITLTNTMMQPFMTEDGVKRMMELSLMNWSSMEDFKEKYDHRNNPDNYVKRISMWNLYENFGRLYREGLIDLGTLHGGTNGAIQYHWAKFKPVIEMYRGSEWSRHQFENFEFVACKLGEFYREKYGEDFFGWRSGEVSGSAPAQ